MSEPSDPWSNESAPAWDSEAHDLGDAPVRDDEAHPFRLPEGGRYERRAMLGWGGMGQVHAVRDRRLRRDVALKEVVVSAGEGSDAAARLAREAWITANLEHPGIVPVYDCGVMPHGRLFYTMRLIRGDTLARALAAADGLSGRMRLLRPMLAVCEAVAFAHSRGIVHRDLKPTNIMVGAFGEAQVVDWGLAREVNDASGGAPAEGTPAYMSPEQASAGPVSARSDVWSLGAVLYELLSGRPPERGVVREAVAGVPAELTAVVARAMHIDPGARYADARELAADLAAWLDGRQVSVYDYSTWELTQRWARRRRAALGVAGVAAATLAVVSAVSVVSIAAERDEARGALVHSVSVHAERALLAGASAEAETLAAYALTIGESPLARGVLAGSVSGSRAERLADVPLPACAEVAIWENQLACAEREQVTLWQLEPLQQLAVFKVRAMNLTFARGRLFGVAYSSVEGEQDPWVLSFEPETSEVRALPILSNGRVVVGAEGLIHLDANLALNYRETGAAESAAVEGCERWHDRVAAVSPDGARVILECGRGLIVGPLAGPYRPLGWGEESGVASLVWTEAWGVVVATYGGDLVTLDPTTGQETARSPGGIGPLHQLAISGERAAASGERGGAIVWNLRTHAMEARLPMLRSHGAAWGGERLFLISDQALMRFQLLDPAPSSFYAFNGLTAIVPSPDGRYLAGTSSSGELYRFDLSTGETTRRAIPGGGTVKDGAWSGERFVAAVLTTGLTWLDEDFQPGVGMPHGVRRVASLSSGHVMGINYTGNVITCDLAGCEVAPMGVDFYDLDERPDLAEVVLLDNTGGGVWVQAVGEVQPRRLFDNLWEGVSAALSPDGERVAIGGHDRVLVTDRSGALLLELTGAGARVEDVAWSPDGQWIAAGDMDGQARVWRSDGELMGVLSGHTRRVVSVAFSPDSAEVYTGSWDGLARRWHLDALEMDAAEAAEISRETWGLDPNKALLQRY